jgi:hypothetical protein
VGRRRWPATRLRSARRGCSPAAPYWSSSRRHFIDDFGPSCRRPLWPNCGRSELWRWWLVFGSIACVNSSSTSWLACHYGGRSAPAARRSSVARPKWSRPRLRCCCRGFDARRVVMDMIAFPIFHVGSCL